MLSKGGLGVNSEAPGRVDGWREDIEGKLAYVYKLVLSLFDEGISRY